jgi:hypothetical protein
VYAQQTFIQGTLSKMPSNINLFFAALPALVSIDAHPASKFCNDNA